MLTSKTVSSSCMVRVVIGSAVTSAPKSSAYTRMNINAAVFHLTFPTSYRQGPRLVRRASRIFLIYVLISVNWWEQRLEVKVIGVRIGDNAI